MNFENINNGLNSTETTTPANIEVKIVTLAGVQPYTIQAGMRVSEFKARYGLTGKKIVDANGETLTDADTITETTELFVSTPKQNG